MNITIHDVVDVSVLKVRSHKDPHVFCSRAIQITDDKGQLYEITLFSDTADQLQIKDISE